MYQYLGPYRSNGKWQKSVAYGTAVPVDELDDAARTHDTRYAMYPGNDYALDAADKEFYDKAMTIGGPIATIAANLVLHGNRVTRHNSILSPNDNHQNYLVQFQRDDFRHNMFLAPILAATVAGGVAGMVSSNGMLPKPKDSKTVLRRGVVTTPPRRPSSPGLPSIPNAGRTDTLVYDAAGQVGIGTGSDGSVYRSSDTCHTYGDNTEGQPAMVNTFGTTNPSNVIRRGRYTGEFRDSDTQVRNTFSQKIQGLKLRITQKSYEQQKRIAKQIKLAKAEELRQAALRNAVKPKLKKKKVKKTVKRVNKISPSS